MSKRKDKVLLPLSLILFIVVISLSIWLNKNISTISSSLVALADIYDPPPPPEPSSLPPGSSATPVPPPGGGTCGDGECSSGEACPEDCSGVGTDCNECQDGQYCCDDDTCSASGGEMGCWANVLPGTPGTSCDESDDCSCSCPAGFDCTAICGAGGCYSSCTSGDGGDDGDGGDCTSSPPDAPVLTTPTVDYAIFGDSITFTWDAISNWGEGCGASHQYYLYVDFNSPPQTLICSTPEGTTQCTINTSNAPSWFFDESYNANFANPYVWRVAATNGAHWNSPDSQTYYLGGLVRGTVYYDAYKGECNTDTPLDVSSGWQVRCGNTDPSVYYTANSSGAGFTCVDDTGDNRLDPTTPGCDPPCGYSVRITPPTDWGFSCNQQGGIAALFQTTPNITNRAFHVTDIHNGWFQSQGGGNVHAATDFTDPIPPSCSGGCDPYLFTDTQNPGIVTYGGVAKPNFGQGNASAKNWKANSSHKGRFYNYDFLFKKLAFPLSKESDFNFVQRLNLQKPASKTDTAYFSDGDITIINNSWQVASGDTIVILVDGDLKIKAEIDVAKGGILAFIVSGDITIYSSVGSDTADTTVGMVEGIYIASGTFSTGGGNKKLVMEGTFAGWSGVDLARDFRYNSGDGSRNNANPVELFIYRPDFIVNLPKFLKKPELDWQEVAP